MSHCAGFDRRSKSGFADCRLEKGGLSAYLHRHRKRLGQPAARTDALPCLPPCGGCAGGVEAGSPRAVAVASGGGAVRFAKARGGLPVADRSHRHRKRGGAAHGAYPRRTGGVRAFFDRGTYTGRTERGQATRRKAGAQAVAFRNATATCAGIARQGRESGGGRQAAQYLPCYAIQQPERIARGLAVSFVQCLWVSRPLKGAAHLGYALSYHLYWAYIFLSPKLYYANSA